MPQRSKAVSVAREAAGMILPACVAATLFFALPREGGSQGERPASPQPAPIAPTCGQWHRGGGETSAVDLGAVKRAYQDLAAGVRRSVDHLAVDVSKDLDRPYDSGIPACRADASRTQPLGRDQVARLRGRIFYFASAIDPDAFVLPLEIEKDPRAEILILRARALKDIPEISRRLGRPVSLGSAEFAKALGVRCSNTWLKVAEKSDGLDLHESR